MNGTDWEEMGSISSAYRFSGRIGHTCAVFEGKMYVIGGQT